MARRKGDGRTLSSKKKKQGKYWFSYQTPSSKYFSKNPFSSLQLYIVKKDHFWSEKMLPKLQRFYFRSVLPELVDPRHTRNMPIREDRQIDDVFV